MKAAHRGVPVAELPGTRSGIRRHTCRHPAPGTAASGGGSGARAAGSGPTTG